MYDTKAENVARMRARHDEWMATPSAERREAFADLVYSTEMLQADVDSGQPYGIMTHPRQAAQLLRLDTPERRSRAMGEAHTLSNLRGGIMSDCLYTAVNDLLRLIEAGKEDEEMWAAGAARRHREAENEVNRIRREVNPGAERVILYPPEMRRD